MSIFIAEKQLRSDLVAALKPTGTGPILIHSDLLRIGIVDKMKPRAEICGDYERIINDALGTRPLLLPTFNYDFCSQGIYDLNRSKAQIGVLSTFMGEKHPALRTRTPVFNFCITNGEAFGRQEIANPFGTDSTFAELHRQGGHVAFLGADFESNTFLHYVEELVGISYRYLKIFDGVIIEDGISKPWQLHYRVRPLREGAAMYDWPKIETDLFRAGILNKFKVGNGTLLCYHTDGLFSFWSEKLSRDPHYLLTETSRKVTDQLYAQFGHPLTFQALEGEAK